MKYQDIFERKERKYILTEAVYQKLRKELNRFMAVDQYGETTILSMYYDTASSLLIRRSMEKPVYKEKLRLRCYGVPESDSPSFIEIKKKFKGIVYKRRIGMSYIDAVQYMEQNKPLEIPSQISREISYFKQFYGDLQPKTVIACERTAMAGRMDPDLRITFDRNIRWRNTDLDLRNGADGKRLLEEGQILMEVKIKDALSWEMAKLFSGMSIYPCSFSKYGEAYRQWFIEDRKKSKENTEAMLLQMMFSDESFSGSHHSLISA